ncbi:MAG: hypothetical protein MI723_19560 [Caulobacterales bacterium]|nr:hypothetical protein [Caulobacterales bacterium]
MNPPEALAEKGDGGLWASAFVAVPFGLTHFCGAFVFLYLFEPAGAWQGPLTTALLCVLTVAAVAAHAMYAVIVMIKSRLADDENGLAESLYKRAVGLYARLQLTLVMPAVILSFLAAAVIIAFMETRAPLWTLIVHPVWVLPLQMLAKSKNVQLPVLLRLEPLSGAVFSGLIFISVLTTSPG